MLCAFVLAARSGSIKRLKKQIKTIRKVMREGGVRNKPLWITEIGWGSAPAQKDRPLVKGNRGQKTGGSAE